MCSSRYSPLVITSVFISALTVGPPVQLAATEQRTVRISAARVEKPSHAGTAAYLTVENGTMYEVYIVGATSDLTTTIELMQTAAGKTGPVKEVVIPAFDRLEMSPDGVFLRLTGLTRALKPGDKVNIVLKTDSGEELTVLAPVQ